MTIQKLEELLNQQESEKLDFKQELSLEKESEKKEFVKDVSAIANSKGGRGYIIFGIQDKTKTVMGITKKSYDEERIHQILCTRLDPPVPVRLDELSYQGKTLMVLTIFKSGLRPHQILQTGTFYIRRGSITDIARRTEIAAMLQESGLISFETTLVSQAALQDFDPVSIKKYLNCDLQSEEKAALYLLEALGMIRKDVERSEYRPTAGGLLLFGRAPQSFLAATGIRVECYKKITLLEGNIPMLLEQAETQIQSIFAGTSYPVHAIYEALYNAIVHRDYWDRTREILLYIDPKKIEIMNPGAIWKKEGQFKMENEFNPPRRNAWLYQRLLLLDKKNRFLNNPLGIRTIQDSFPEGEKSVRFVNLPKKNLFKVVLPGLADFS